MYVALDLKLNTDLDGKKQDPNQCGANTLAHETFRAPTLYAPIACFLYKNKYKIKFFMSRYSLQASADHDIRQATKFPAHPHDLQQRNHHAQRYQRYNGWIFFYLLL
jgi:hypothetical protein